MPHRAAFPSDRLFLIAGPCVIENDELLFRIADHLAKLAPKVPGGVIFKASFDKANRSNAGAFRGPGIEEGLRTLERVREHSGLPVLTDVHLPEHCAMAAEAVDVLQIPAFLCRQTDLLEAAGATGLAVNVKKGQWMHHEGMAGAVQKVYGAENAYGMSVKYFVDRLKNDPSLQLLDLPFGSTGMTLLRKLDGESSRYLHAWLEEPN